MTLAPIRPAEQTTVLTEYEALEARIELAQQHDATLTFDYRAPRDNKAARSHLAQLRKLKAEIDRRRKDAGEYHLLAKRSIDASAKELEERVIDLIAPHKAALDALAQEEADRIAAHEAVITSLQDAGSFLTATITSTELDARLHFLKEVDTSGLEEFCAEGIRLALEGIAAINNALPLVHQREKDEADLAAFRAAEQARQQAEHDAAIAAAAAEAARLEAAAALAASEQARLAAEAKLEAHTRTFTPEAAASDHPEAGLCEILDTITRTLSKWRGSGMSAREMAEALLAGRLHPALTITIDWSQV
jgi:hypothetical protein